ncbi:ABC transporter ATP-binding protein [Nitratireductor sp. GISD-1A_MAKvit]|uniref:ABC transporter ATP-binding protein n=1 Tax=Nitratireductor sp. GISD-1A_MAKvit TaxID=3234198 RepID=UPI0034673EB4
MSLLSVKNLHVRLRTDAGLLHAVRGVDLSVEPGQTLCLVGESGCGKSMTALAMLGLLPPSAVWEADEIEIAGTDLRGATQATLSSLRGNRVSMIFQEPMTALNPTFTIGDQLCAVHRRHRGSGRLEARRRAIYLLERVGITNARGRLGQYPHELSGGLRQRVLIAMALMCEPELIICDEPTTALDVTTQAQILALLAELREELGMGMIFITHDLGVVSRIGDHINVMYAGRTVEKGTRDAVLGRAGHPYTQGLVRSVPRPGKTEKQTPLGTIPGTVPSFYMPDPLCPFRGRCERKTTVCDQVPPPLVQGMHDGNGAHAIFCHNTQPALTAEIST